MNADQRTQLLRDLRFDAGQAEAARPDQIGVAFYPVPEHLRALEPEVVLVVGDRGAGKSMLVAAAASPTLRSAVVARTPGLRVPTRPTSWSTGFPLHSAGPDAAGWERFSREHAAEAGALQELWFAYLARLLAERLDEEGKAALEPLRACQGGDAEGCFAAFREARVAVLLALDRLDHDLAERDEWLHIAYDELDTVVLSDREAMGAVMRGIVSFWASYARRWKRIRGKLFLRSDFYRRHTDVGGADIAKLAANRVELTWSDKALYGLLIKKIANLSDGLYEYCKRSNVKFDEDPQLGHIPTIDSKEGARPFVERLAGPFMGASGKKGQSLNWMLDSVRDGNRSVSPRSLVLLVELAAQRELSRPRAARTQLLHPVSLRNALDEVSKSHIMAASGEFRWLSGVKERLQAGREVPWQRKALEKLLEARWGESWSTTEKIAAPAEGSRELVDYLVELGILRDRGANRFDVPDLFLEGLNLVRRGGVARR